MSTIIVISSKPWKYLLGALLALIILIPLWILFVMTVVQPDSLMTQEQTMGNRLLWWVAGPVGIVTVLFGGRWMLASQTAHAKQTESQVQVHQVAPDAAKGPDYVLEIIGLGVTLDKYRQGKLWEALQGGSPQLSIREQDPKKYAWSQMERSGTTGERYGSSLENGAQYTPMYWGVPVFNAGAPKENPADKDSPINPEPGLVGGAVSSGMAWHLFVIGPRRFEERPDRIMEEVFAFFDANPDVPYVVVNSADDMYSRDLSRAPGSPTLMKDGYYIPEMPDASTLFVLARRERVDAVRPFVFDDVEEGKVSMDVLNAKGFARRLFLAYSALERAVPHPDKEKDPQAKTERQPLISEWLPAAAAFSHRPDIAGTRPISLLESANPWAHRPPKDWKPTPWFPIPWNKDQLATFDRLPTLGFVHRPTFVKFTDEHGTPVTRRDDREKLLQAGWQQALQSLPEAERKKAPARVITGNGGNTDQTILLHSLLNDYASHGGPELTAGKGNKLIDTDKRLGNTGAATWFVQMAIGVMGSYREGGVSAAVNLRDPNEASIVFISPPSDEKRKNQKHPNGGDVFAHHGSPAIDPDNYK